MYAVICAPEYWKEIEQAIASKGEQILFKVIDTDVDIVAEFDKIGRLAIHYLILDINAVEDSQKLLRAVKNYRIMNDKTRFIIIAPGGEPGNQTLSSLAAMGIWDILVPTGDSDMPDDLHILSALLEVLEKPTPFKKALKWYMDELNTNASAEQNNKKPGHNFRKFSPKSEPVEKVEVIKEVIREVPVMQKGLKETILFWGLGNTGTSFTAVNFSVLLARLGAKVGLVDLNDTNYELFSYFDNTSEHQGLKTLLSSSVEANVMKTSIHPEKNLWVFTHSPSVKVEWPEGSLFQIQDRLREQVDFIVGDVGSELNKNSFENFKIASKVFLVIEPNFPKIISLKQTLREMQNAGINLAKFSVILNRYNPLKVFPLNLINDELGLNVATMVPPVYPIGTEAHIKGKPALEYKEAELLEKALRVVVERIWTVTRKKTGLLSFLK